MHPGGGYYMIALIFSYAGDAAVSVQWSNPNLLLINLDSAFRI